MQVGKRPALWVYKCNAIQHGERIAFADWNEFFARPQPAEWGGSMTMASQQSLRILWKDMAEGDLVLCWQTDKRQAVGLCQVDSLRDSFEDDDTPRRELWLELLGEPFSPPVPLLDMRKQDPELAAVKCFHAGFPSTLYGTTEAEAKALLRACGVSPTTLTTMRSARSVGAVPASGGGFGTAEENQKVERAAVAAFRRKYSAWQIEDLQKQNVGYDFVVRRGSQERHVELKGTRGPNPSFIITRNERTVAEQDERWHLVVVTNALTKTPTIHEWARDEFLAEFELEPISYMAKRQGL